MTAKPRQMKVLNLYAGLGGNRKLWQDVEVTAVELDESICQFYQDQYPNDTVICGDAHQYLLENYRAFDFIWSSFPCPSHSKARFWSSKGGKYNPVYPDLGLYEEIIFLQHFADNAKWVVENVDPYYNALLNPTKIGRHLFWSNFEIARVGFGDADIRDGKREDWERLHGISIKGYKFNQRTDKLLRNCVNPQLGLHILKESKRIGMFSFT